MDEVHEARLTEEYCGGDYLLRQAYAEYRQMLKEKDEAERSLPRTTFGGSFYS